MKNLLFFFLFISPIPGQTGPSSSLTADPGTACRRTAGWGDVVFSEVMYDPDPPVALPCYEYLELLSRSEELLCLEGWELWINTRMYELPHDILSPGERVVLTSPGWAEEYADPVRIVPVFGSGSVLPNSGAIMALYDTMGNLVHATRYRVPWDAPVWKKEGGWSLESPDEEMSCILSGLWEFSVDQNGGTPGRKNSISRKITDEKPPVFLHGSRWESGDITLTFSEPVMSSPSGTQWVDLQVRGGEFKEEPGGFQSVPGRLEPGNVLLLPGNLRPDSLVSSVPTGEQVRVFFAPGQVPAGEFRLVLSDIMDCAGNPLEERVIGLGPPGEPAPGCILINEIMYDPREGEPEFIELYIPGTMYYDLKEFAIEAGNLHPLSTGSRIVAPGDHLLLGRNILHLADNYDLGPSGRWIEVAGLDLPGSTGGTIRLTDRAGNTVDLVTYHDDMHLQLLGDTKGVSLERISTGRPGNDPGNWHSAASLEGYSTPGRPNSQSSRCDISGTMDPGRLLITEPRVFSPDNDGFQDLLEIRVELGSPGFVIRLWITDTQGVPVRDLASNHVAAPSLVYTWDGEKDDGRMADEGIYVVHLAAYHANSGSSRTRRVAVGLIYR